MEWQIVELIILDGGGWIGWQAGQRLEGLGAGGLGVRRWRGWFASSFRAAHEGTIRAGVLRC